MRKESTRYILASIAEQDLSDIFDYTEVEYGFDQAVHYLEALEDTFTQLVENPEFGRVRTDIREGLRSITCNSHIVFYRIMLDHIRIVRVLHGSRDLPQFL